MTSSTQGLPIHGGAPSQGDVSKLAFRPAVPTVLGDRQTSFQRLAFAAGRLKEIAGRIVGARQPRRLQVSETLSLGEKRSLHIVKVDGAEYLIAGGNATVSLLAKLGGNDQAPRFEDTLQQAWQEGPSS